MKRIFVSLNVDDLDARSDPTRSGCIGGYGCTPEEIQQVLALINQIKARSKAAYEERRSKMTPEQKANELDIADKILRDNARREADNNRYGDAAN